MNTADKSTAEILSDLLDIEIMVRQAITDGTILDVMKERKGEIHAAFLPAGNPDPKVQKVFRQHPFMSTFIGSWKDHRSKPGFVDHWQKTVSVMPISADIVARQAMHTLPAQPPATGITTTSNEQRSEDEQPLAQVVLEASKRKRTGLARPGPPQTVAAPSGQASPAPRTPAPPTTAPHTPAPHPAPHTPAPASPHASPVPAPAVAKSKTGRPVRVTRTVHLRDPVETNESSPGSEDDFVPDPPAGAKTKRTMTKNDVTPREGGLHSDVEMAPLTEAEGGTSKPKNKRRTPKAAPGGQHHNPPCDFCAKRKQPCVKEIGGGACLACAKNKARCKYSGVKGQRTTGQKKPRRRTSYKREPLHTGSTERRHVKSNKREWVDVDEEEEEEADEEEDDIAQPAACPVRHRVEPAPAARATQAPAPSALSAEAWHILETNFQGNLDQISEYFDQEMNLHVERYSRTQEKIAHVERQAHEITDRLEAILQRAASRISVLEEQAAKKLERLEETVDTVVATLTEVCASMGLGFGQLDLVNRHQLLQRYPPIRQVPAAKVTWLGNPRPAGHVMPVFGTEQRRESIPPPPPTSQNSGVLEVPPAEAEAGAAGLTTSAPDVQSAHTGRASPSPIGIVPDIADPVERVSPPADVALPTAAAEDVTTVSPRGVAVDVDLVSSETQAPEILPALPKIRRVPATPANSQDTQATHITIHGSQGSADTPTPTQTESPQQQSKTPPTLQQLPVPAPAQPEVEQPVRSLQVATPQVEPSVEIPVQPHPVAVPEEQPVAEPEQTQVEQVVVPARTIDSEVPVLPAGHGLAVPNRPRTRSKSRSPSATVQGTGSKRKRGNEEDGSDRNIRRQKI